MATASQYLHHTTEQVIFHLVASGMLSDATRVAACRYRSRRCGLIHICPLCRWSKGDNTWDDLLPRIRASVEQGARLMPVTFWTADVPLSSLRDTFHHIRQSVHRVAEQITGLAGIVWNFESVPSELTKGYEHPHVHALLSLDPARNRGRHYTSSLRLHELWAERGLGGRADVVDLTKDSYALHPDHRMSWRSIAERREAYASYLLKASPAQVKRQIKAELEYDFVPRIQQLHGLHRLNASGSLQPQQPALRAA
jgi:hypothetical protein